ncbi:hypothetical protein B277_01669 [Janibacter hoylei PVAS-1]|uniref:DUF2079 domain-containing protein n=1 Tax=Janibacter hoylei PVAS-1 TaxID=1210046 RepID=K1ETQ6_9MICO|nr:DUF2079 domain-containing protein [Janibacter hoylei]EKA62543.1 hypothetical protein B277_01669 [Janibacter hoylei PVAS-1]
MTTTRQRLWSAGGAGAVAWAFYTWIGVARYSRGEYGNYDLGIFVQAAHSWLTLGRPYSDIKGINLLGDHFSPITVLFALAYQMWADPRALIVAQSLALALVVAISTWSVARAGARSVKVGGVALVALLALPQVSAAGFQVHETALGAPFVLLLAMSVVTGARRPALVLTLAVLTIKEDAGLMVAGAGAAWFLIHRERRMAAGLAGLGAVGFIVSNAVILWVNPGHQNPYLRYFTSGDTSGGGLDSGGDRTTPRPLRALRAAGGVALVSAAPDGPARPRVACRLVQRALLVRAPALRRHHRSGGSDRAHLRDRAVQESAGWTTDPHRRHGPVRPVGCLPRGVVTDAVDMARGDESPPGRR